MMLLEAVEAMLAARGLAPSRFGRMVAGDPRLVFDLRRGRRPSAALVRKLEQALDDLAGPGVRN